MLKVLIVGANYNNKGAQSMLFITVDEIKKRFSEADIYFATAEIIDEKNLTFKRIYYNELSKSIALGGITGKIAFIKSIIKDCVKFIIGKRNNLWMSLDLKHLLPTINLIIDVSGFNLGKKWSVDIQEAYLTNIKLAKKYNIDMYLMPQSFGPFDYDKDKKFLLDEINDLLQYPIRIYARENNGYKLLVKNFGLRNVELSADLVLQNSGIELEHIYKTKMEIELPLIASESCVAIIPNNQCIRYGNKDVIIDIYKRIIEQLLVAKKEVYIFRHSGEDLRVCKWIKDSFIDNDHVHMLDNDFNCIEYSEFIKGFQFVICSRFHGIVHAYRNFIPCIALGWAAKYQELTKVVDQEKYSFDITSQSFNASDVMFKLSYMIDHFKDESNLIQKNVVRIQRDNCFSFLNNIS